MMLLLIYLLTLTTRTARSAFTSISTGSGLLAFSQEVNSGSTYSGSTVTLANDIDLTGIDFIPIGKFDSNGLDFRGVFEGNGHLIKNLVFSSSAVSYAGLFGYTNGCTIRNVVIDSSCSITNGNSMTGYASGIVGYVNSGVIETKILNCVNMGTITGAGPYSKVGGIAGCLYGYTYTITTANCVNLGDIAYSGTTVTKSFIGGIVGWVTSSFSTAVAIYNCVNMGTITQGSANLTGGIVGSSTATSSVIQHNYWLSGTASKGYNGDGSASGNEVFDSNYALSSGSPLVSALNEYVSSSSLGLRNWYTVAFSVNGGSTVSSMIAMWVLLGTPGTSTKTEGAFNGWYTDSSLNTPWSSSTRFSSSSTLYAKWTMNRYTVKFNSTGGSEVPSITSEYGSAISLSTPTKTGYTFKEWRDEEGITHINTYTINKARTVTLTAQWSPNRYTVKFNSTGGTEVPPVTSDYGSAVLLSTPTKTGYTFGGWRDEDGITYINYYTINKATTITLTAQWSPNQYTVAFNSTGGTEVSSITRDYGSTISLSAPTKTGYTFDGWRDEDGITYISAYIINKARTITLTAQWSPNQYTVKFNSTGGSEVPPVTSDYGSAIPLSTPTKTGYTFGGWRDEDGITYTSSYTINKARTVTLTAQWSAINYTVTFDFGNGTIVNESFPFNETINYPEDPVMEGYAFEEWNNKHERMPAGDITIDAVWNIRNYTVTFDFGDGTVIESHTLDYNDKIDYPKDPVRERYKFIGWNNNITEMPAEDITITALWEEIPTEYVEIVFNKKDMTEDEVRDFISKYASNDNYILKVIGPENGGTAVIVKFEDATYAKNFVETIKSSEEVKSACYLEEAALSLAAGVINSSILLLFLGFIWG